MVFHKPWSRRPCRPGFTLTELLVVVAVIAALSALLFPVVAQARRRSQEASCISNLRQIGQAMRMYIDDYGLRPVSIDRTAPFAGDRRIFLCPADQWIPDGGWAWSAWGQFNKP